MLRLNWNILNLTNEKVTDLQKSIKKPTIFHLMEDLIESRTNPNLQNLFVNYLILISVKLSRKAL